MDPVTVDSAITGWFSDLSDLFLTTIVPGVGIIAVASIGITWAIRKARQNAK